MAMLIDPALQKELDRLPRESRRGHGLPAREGLAALRNLRKPERRPRARLERLFQRLFAERPCAIHVLIDASLSMTYTGYATPQPSAKFEFARRLSAALGYAALQRYGHVRVTAFAMTHGRRAPRLPGRQSTDLLLAYLERLRPGGNAGFAAALRNILARSPQDSYLVLISDFRDPHWLQGMPALLHGSARRALVHLQDRTDLEPVSERIQLVDPGTGLARTVDGVSERRRSRIDDDLQFRLVEMARQFRFDYVPVSIETRFEEMLLRSLGLAESRAEEL